MSEPRSLWLMGPTGRLEAILRVACPARAMAVVAHPHPQYGGTLHNPVVFHVDRELHRVGFSTLRFNFRGVGNSDGEFDQGTGEIEDVAAATSWLRGMAPALPLLLVGYSFGSYCTFHHALTNPGVAALLSIGLPVRTYSFAEASRLRRPWAVVQGETDEFGSPDEVRAILADTDPRGRLWVVPGAGHLFPHQAPTVARYVVEAALDLLGTAREGGAGAPG